MLKEVPVGAVVVKEGVIVGEGWNTDCAYRRALPQRCETPNSQYIVVGETHDSTSRLAQRDKQPRLRPGDGECNGK